MSCLMVSGCQTGAVWPFSAWPAPTPHEGGAPPETTASTTHESRLTPSDRVQVVQLAFDVLRVEMPVDEVRHSRKVWNHVDELRLDSDRIARLRRNGLRVGAASSSAWAPIRAILEAGGAKMQKDQMLPQPGTPLAIEFASIQESESFFSYDRDNRLVGKTFSEGRKIIQLDYAFHPQLGGSTDLQVDFEVQNDRGEMVWERRDGVIRQVPAFDRHVFENLAAALTLKPGEFLVLGPGDQADNEYLIGSRFFVQSAQGDRKETLLFVTPQPFQTSSVRRAP